MIELQDMVESRRVRVKELEEAKLNLAKLELEVAKQLIKMGETGFLKIDWMRMEQAVYGRRGRRER